MSRTDFRGGVAVITGAGSGIGAGLVTHAASLGMRIALADVDATAIEQQADELAEAGIEALAVPTDVRDADQVDALAGRVYATWGRTTLLVNNAGIELHGKTWELPVDQWHRLIDINLNGIFHGIRSFVPRMLDQASRAHLVNISSISALRTNPGTSSYAAAKHGNLALSDCLRAELATVSDEVVVTAVLPGAVRTRIFEDAFAAHDDGFGDEARRAMADLIRASGIDPVEAARIIFEGAARGDAHVHTDPAMSRELIEARHAELLRWAAADPVTAAAAQ